MTEDPMFHQSDSAAEQLVDHRADIQTRDNACNGGRSMTMLDGRFVDLPSNDWPDIEPDEMPWVELVSEHVPGMGAPVVLVDNATLIDELVLRFNSAAAAAARPGFRCEDEFPNGPGADDDTGATLSGCGCRTPGDRGSAGWMLMALGLVLGSAARRRR